MKNVLKLCLLLLAMTVLCGESSAQTTNNHYFKISSLKKLNDKTIQIEGHNVADDFQTYVSSVVITKNRSEPKLEKTKRTLKVILSPTEKVDADEIITANTTNGYNYFMYSLDNNDGGFMHIDIEKLATLELKLQSVEEKR